jgi:7,8-dihydro-6-hydroxymethylpterin-pyrophosphokinase
VNTALAYVSGGSNLDAEIHLRQAARELKARYPGARFSRCYRNKSVEKLCGRPEAAPRWAPRSMDLDILLIGDQVIDEPGMKVPRPDLLRWAFMLGPLAELAPDLVHPVEQTTIGELWRRFDSHAQPLAPVALDLNAS